jgi:hypothetical protein
MSSTIELRLSCHCHAFNHIIRLPTAAFPLKSSVCHCTTCRHVSGHLFATFAVIPLPLDQAPQNTGLKAYNKTRGITRWFCTTCGASCWLDNRSADGKESLEWEIPTGVVDEVLIDGEIRKEGIAGLLDRVQIWVCDTKDGGGASWVNGGRIDGMDRRFVGRSSDVLDDKKLKDMVEDVQELQKSSHAEGEIEISCSCRAVELKLVKAQGHAKYKAGIDACESCRRVSGFEITSWVTVPTNCISMSDSTPLNLNADCFGMYMSSEKLQRIFCKGCGATVLCKYIDRDTIDIAVGLLDAAGARADIWLDWTKYGDEHVGYTKDAIDRDFIEGLVTGIRRSNSENSS